MPPSDLPSGLIVIHSNLSESLRDVLVSWLRRYPLAPLEQETVLVQSSGIAQWLKLALAQPADSGEDGEAAGGTGIAAAMDFLLPSRFLWQAYRAALGAQAVPEVSPFDKPRLLWRLMRLLPQVVGEPAYAPLRRFLSHDDDCRKRYQLAERLADLYDQYQVYRADWLAAWDRGEDVLPRDRGDALPLPPAQQWQAALWRALLDDVRSEEAQAPQAASAGRAAVHAAFMGWAAAQGDAVPAGLPRRVVVFGISTLPRQSLEVLAALSRWTQVLMCVHNPCEHFWSDIIEGRELLRARGSRQARRAGAPAEIAEEALHLHAHPLLAAWGKQGRDFIGLLDEHDDASARNAVLASAGAEAQRVDLFASPGQDTLLRQLQDDIRDLRPLHETQARWPAVDPRGDASIRFHLAHSRQREVEVLHDQLLAMLDGDASLRARDIIVMVPDIDAYAPHIQAVFGLHAPPDPRAIAYTVADRGSRHVDPLLQAVEQLLQLSWSRFSASDLMDLLEVPAVRHRYGIGADQISLLHGWIRGANIRWGLHDAQRRTLGLPGAGAEAAPNTWLFGLRRILLGYAVGEKGGCWNGIEPFGDIGGLDAALAGPLVELVDALDRNWRTLAEPATPAVWAQRLQALLDAFFLPDTPADAYTLQRLTAGLQQWLTLCAEARMDDALPLAVVAEHWMAGLDDSGLSQRFFGGAVTFATLMPMRAIPFRVVCLLGMNDGDYPRARVPMDFDLMGRDYRPGDRSRREDDRYLFLEALLSARDRLYVSWVGRSVRDNTPRPPSVLVAQLRDHLAAGWQLRDGAAHAGLLAALTTVHRLQPFSNAYFASGAGDPAHADGLFTYAVEWEAAGGETMAPTAPPPATDAPAAELPVDPRAILPAASRLEPLTLAELAAFLKTPVEAFFKQRLKVVFETDELVTEDVEPFAPDGLLAWQVQNALIAAQARAVEQGADPIASGGEALGRVRRAGVLADGAFGELTARDLQAPLNDMMRRYALALAEWPHALAGELHLRFQAGDHSAEVDLEDWLGGLRGDASGAHARIVLESSDLVVDNKYRADKVIGHWVAHVAAHACGAALCTLVVSKAGNARFEPLPREAARAMLRTWLQAWDAGMRRPLPLALRAAFEWLTRKPEGAGEESTAAARESAAKVYEGNDRTAGEVSHSPYLQRVYPDFATLCASGEFEVLAETLYRPMRMALYSKGSGARGDE